MTHDEEKTMRLLSSIQMLVAAHMAHDDPDPKPIIAALSFAAGAAVQIASNGQIDYEYRDFALEAVEQGMYHTDVSELN